VGQAALFYRRLDSAVGERGALSRPPADCGLLFPVLNCIQDALVITVPTTSDERFRVVYANPAFVSLFNGNNAPLPKDGEDSSRDGDASCNDDPLWKGLEEGHRRGDVYTTELTRPDRDGFPVLLQLRSEPIPIPIQNQDQNQYQNPSGASAYRLAVFRDITAQRGLEKSLRRNERLACIGLLGAEIAHEINNPTGSALLAAETALAVKDIPGAGEQLGACLRNIITSMDRCGRIVRTLLRYSRQEPTERQACSINDVVEQALELARPYGDSHGAELHMDLDAAVPLVPMNPLEIELVLVNLIRNAVEAGQEKTIITVGTARIAGGVRVVVRDNGRGMNEEQLLHVFDPLYTTRRRLGGSGLGMSIALGIVRGHEGRMEVQSQKGEGTTVIVDLPVAAGFPEQNDRQNMGQP